MVNRRVPSGEICGKLRKMRRVTYSFLGLLAVLMAGCDGDDPAPPPAGPPATRPAPPSAAEPDPASRPLATLDDLIRRDFPDYGKADRRPSPAPFDEAGRFAIDTPVHLDANGNLWITDPRGRPVAEIISDPATADLQTFVVDQPVRFVWWRAGPGGPTPEVITDDEGGLVWHHALGSVPLPDLGYRFDSAFVWDEAIVTPVSDGIALLRPALRVEDVAQFLRRFADVPPERRPDASGTVDVEHLVMPGADRVRPETRADGVGLIAWVPWDEANQLPGGDGVYRFADGTWSKLDADDGWGDRPVHLMPLADGSVLQLALDENDEHVLSVVALNKLDVDPALLHRAVDGLTHHDRALREASFATLASAGSAAWPVLEERLPRARGRAVGNIESLLAARDTPSLGGLRPMAGPVHVRQRLADGGVILEFRNGVRVPDVAGVDVLRRPGFVIVRPGRRVGPLAEPLAVELAMKGNLLQAVADEIVITPAQGEPKRWSFNHFQPILRPDDPAVARTTGIDRAGRWLFESADGTLLVDPWLPDPTPRLPTWIIETGELGEAGWDDQDFPCMKLGGAWRLQQFGWEPLPPETRVATEAVVSGRWELAIGLNGTRYYGGVDALRVVPPDGTEFTWPLPPEARGLGEASDVKLAVDDQGRLFLFNRPGRVVRIEPVGDPGEPLEVIGVFDEQIPGATPRRVWVDPLGRICAAYFGDTVAVMWPDGEIPGPIRQLMPAKRRPMERPDTGF
jgi:hypothetical protein